MSALLTSATNDVVLGEQQPLKTSTAARNGRVADDSEATSECKLCVKLIAVLQRNHCN